MAVRTRALWWSRSRSSIRFAFRRCRNVSTEAAAIAVSPVAAVKAKNAFIVSPTFDAFFFFGSVGAVFAGWLAASYFKVNGFYVLAAVAATSNGPHLGSTW